MYSASANAPLTVSFPDSGIYILESHHSGAFFMPPTRHPFLKLVYVLKGAGSVSLAAERLAIGAEDVLIVPPEQEHQIDDAPKKPLALIVLCTEKKVFEDALSQSDLLARVRVIKPVGDEVRKLLRHLFFEQSLQKPQSALMMTGLSLQLLALLCRFDTSAAPLDNETKPGQYAAKTLAGVRVNTYAEQLRSSFHIDESLGEVAARLGISRRYFSLLFKEHTGESWLSYVRNLRIDYAKKLLASSDRSVTTITFECGFNDLSNFYRCFKKLEGTSPERWRQVQRSSAQKNA